MSRRFDAGLDGAAPFYTTELWTLYTDLPPIWSVERLKNVDFREVLFNIFSLYSQTNQLEGRDSLPEVKTGMRLFLEPTFFDRLRTRGRFPVRVCN